MISVDLLYLIIISTFITIKLSGVLADPIDPFKPVEDTAAFVALGGLWDNFEVHGEEKQE